MARLNLIADVHASLPALEAVLDELPRARTLHLGDVVGYNPHPGEVIELLRERRIPSVMGNHDMAVVTGDTSWFNPVAARAIEWTREQLGEEELSYLASLPLEMRTEEVYAVHGSPRRKLEEYVYPDYPEEVLEGFAGLAMRPVIALGHLHIPFVRRTGDTLVLNPGSVGQPRDGCAKASFATIDLETLEVEVVRVEYDIDRVARDILRAGLPAILAQRLYAGY
ncbi:MAG: metallophosphoesterase family protein [Euryarchaeota archaeon]|nr:metallophosphoesterase family protein [Euryarchaeota archaeon]